MGLQMRDDRQTKALTGLSQAQFDHLLPVFSDIYRTTQQQMYEEGVASGTRRRHPGGGSKGKLPTMADKLQFILYYYKLTVSLGVTCAVVYTYGCDDGRISPTRCALIDAAPVGRYSQRRACRIPPAAT